MANARQVMYAARRLVEERGILPPGKIWADSKQFTQGYLPDYTAANPEATADWDVVYDSRGSVIEPHTDLTTPLGTVAVRNYLARWKSRYEPSPPVAEVVRRWETCGPVNRFRHVLFIEKEGFHEAIKRSGLTRRLDVGLQCTKGMTVVACRRLVDEFGRLGVVTHALHDFDKTGLAIARSLAADSRRYTFKNSPLVSDIGVRLADVREMGLLDETVIYPKCKNDPKEGIIRSGGSPEEAAFLVRTQLNPRTWQGKRVELNAMTNDQLVEFIERKLVAAGARKLVPSEAELATAFAHSWRCDRLDEEAAKATERVNRMTCPPPPDGLSEMVNEHLQGNPTESWEQATAAVARRLGRSRGRLTCATG